VRYKLYKGRTALPQDFGRASATRFKFSIFFQNLHVLLICGEHQLQFKPFALLAKE
jgi:hypothetical protein